MMLSASGENASHVARRTTSPFCAVAAMAEVSVPFPNSFMRVPLSQLISEGSKGIPRIACDCALSSVGPRDRAAPLLRCFLPHTHIQLNPGRRVFAGMGSVADPAIDAGVSQASCRFGGEQQMIDAQSRILLAVLTEIVPKGVDALLWIASAHGIGSSLSEQALIALAAPAHLWNASVDVRRRTRRNVYTIRGAAPSVTSGGVAADRAGARPLSQRHRLIKSQTQVVRRLWIPLRRCLQ
jgi:hypothetical protein